MIICVAKSKWRRIFHVTKRNQSTVDILPLPESSIFNLEKHAGMGGGKLSLHHGEGFMGF